MFDPHASTPGPSLHGLATVNAGGWTAPNTRPATDARLRNCEQLLLDEAVRLGMNPWTILLPDGEGPVVKTAGEEAAENIVRMEEELRQLEAESTDQAFAGAKELLRKSINDEKNLVVSRSVRIIEVYSFNL